MGLNIRGCKTYLTRGVAIIAGASACLGADAAAQGVQPSVEDLRSLSIDALANIKVTSVSKRPEALSETPAAVFVITSDDIRRSGATSLPEALRLAPNLEVARINAYSWTVTARGFNSPETANKLLVLVNGRSVYEPIGSGVLWQQVDVDMTTVDRIEVISGPGGTMWGANAVNGVINVITKKTGATRGLNIAATGGDFERTASVAYGARLGRNMSFKVYADGFSYDHTEAALASDTTNDAFRGTVLGFRFGGAWQRDNFSVRGSTYDNSIADDGGTLRGHTLSSAWTHTGAKGVVTSVNAYLSRDTRSEPTLYESRDVIDFEAQQSRQIGTAHSVIWGGEFRSWRENFQSFNDFHFANPKTTISLGSLFAQDEVALRPGLKLTLGLKYEDNSYSGGAWLPNIRLAWQADETNLWWAAMSGAERTPNRIERELEHPVFLLPAPDFQPEKLTAYEAGWRARPSRQLSLSLSAFFNVYDDLRTDSYPATIFPIVLANDGHGETWGFEGWAKYAVTPDWRLSAGFNLLHKHFYLTPGTNDLTQLGVRGQDPSYQAQLRSQWNLSDAVDFDLALRTVGKVDTAPVPAYTEADAHLGYRLNDKVELALDGHNLLHKRHIEVWDPSTTAPRYVPRSVFVTVRYGF
ncbi:MAG: TonB-dependent receptor plug domain-containing protein [Asticcacaulis sp.]